MEKEYLFFISHCSEDNALAQQLHDLLLRIEPAWEGRIFLDCSKKKPLETSTDWKNTMLRAVENSRHLIFITSHVDHVKEGYGWLYEEVSHFRAGQISRFKAHRPELNVSSFGIFLCPCDLEGELFQDSALGSAYKSNYKWQEHLVGGAGSSLQQLEGTLREKVLAMVGGASDDDFAADLLERVRSFTARQIADGAMAAEADLDGDLLPRVAAPEDQDDEEEQGSSRRKSLDFAALREILAENHVQLIGSEGGCGKTSLMTALFHHHLRQCGEDLSTGRIPLFVDAKSLAADNHLILRYLAKTLYGEATAMTDKQTGDRVAALSTVFSLKRESPRYLLLIDGYNELPAGSVKKLNRELRSFLPNGAYPNVRVMISGRAVDMDLPEGVFRPLEVLPLPLWIILNYLQRVTGRKAYVPRSMQPILSSPMYLKLFADTGVHSEIRSRTDLLREFLNWQDAKDDAAAQEESDGALCRILLHHVMPAVAHGMVTGSSGSSFILTEDTLQQILEGVIGRLNLRDYRKYYGSDYRQTLKSSGCDHMDELDLSDAFTHYFTKTCKLLHRDSSGNLDFVHQIYRDFFCACYIAEDLRFSLSCDVCTDALSRKQLEKDVLFFITELLGEEVPRYDHIRGSWDYSCNDTSCLVGNLQLLRRHQPEGSARCAANLLELLRLIRNGDLSALDLSQLDLTQADLRNCVFTAFDRTGSHSTRFTGARINRENLFADFHRSAFLAACTNEQYAACLDSDGYLKLWEKKPNPQFPVKTLTGLYDAVTKLLFAPGGNALLAMTAHKILEIPLPEAALSKAQPRTLLQTPHRLQDIRLDHDQLRYSTVSNPFNYKPLTGPDTPDTVPLYGITSAAAVTEDGDFLAFGQRCDINCLQLMRKTADGTYEAISYGFGQILEAYLLELEQLLREFGLYEAFQTDNEETGERRSFFVRLQRQFMDRTHHYEQIPRILLELCLEVVGERLAAGQLARLQALAEDYRLRLKQALDENGQLIHLAGRVITGLSFQEGGRALLVSAGLDYTDKHLPDDTSFDPKKPVDNMVTVVDLDTLQARPVHYSQSKALSRGFYCGRDMVIVGKYQVRVYDENGDLVLALSPHIHHFSRFFSPPGTNDFYIFSNQHIYQLDQHLRCRRSFRHSFRSTRLFYFQDLQGGEYLCTAKKRDPHTPNLGRFFDLQTGKSRPPFEDHTVPRPSTSNVKIGLRQYKYLNNELHSFYRGTKEADVCLYHCLHVCGCDFTGLQGTVAEPAYLQILAGMGAVTDPFPLPPEQPLPDPATQEILPPVSAAPLRLSEDLPRSNWDNRTQLRLFGNSGKLRRTKTWELILRDSIAGQPLESTDYAIVEWVDRLRFATADMIRDLTAAGLIPPPRGYEDTGKRMTEELTDTYKFLFRTEFFAGGDKIGPGIATVQFPFGARVLESITGDHVDDPLTPRVGDPVTSRSNKLFRQFGSNDPEFLQQVRTTLALGSWFAITARRYRQQLEDHALNEIFETENHFIGSARVNGYLRLGQQAFFAQAVRDLDPNVPDKGMISKVQRLCLLAFYYRSLITRKRQQIEGLTRQPVIVLICEDLPQCRLLHSQVEHLYPSVRKIYTFDALLQSEEAAAGAGNYLEIRGDDIYSLRLEDLIG